MIATQSSQVPRVRLMRREQVAERTFAFHFEKPAGFSFAAGQTVDITLLSPRETDAEGNKRTFSIASAPHEPTLMIATRMRDTAFKRVLHDVALGTTVNLEGPSGDLTLQKKSARSAIILTGGIGITPFRSMLVDAAKRRLSQRIFVFYANRRPEDAAFLDELTKLQAKNANYTLIPTMTQARFWGGETGMIDGPMIARHTQDARAPIYYVAGPPGMVHGLQVMLRHAGVHDDDIRAEEFAGY